MTRISYGGHCKSNAFPDMMPEYTVDGFNVYKQNQKYSMPPLQEGTHHFKLLFKHLELSFPTSLQLSIGICLVVGALLGCQQCHLTFPLQFWNNKIFPPGLTQVPRWRGKNGHMLIGLICQVIPSPSNNSATTVIALLSVDLLILKV